MHTRHKRRACIRELLSLVLIALPCGAHALRTDEDFNFGWRFSLGDHAQAVEPDFDDSSWQTVALPHDWAIGGPFDPKADGSQGKLPWRGVGWYRKAFTLPAENKGDRVYLDFDGVMAFPQVYVNGRLAGQWDYGYMSFRVDATDFIKFGRKNVVVVRADTTRHDSRWYPGAGIYRKVTLTVCDPVHVAHWGTCVTTPSVSDESAAVRVKTVVVNDSPRVLREDGGPDPPRKIEVETTLEDPQGNVVVAQTGEVSVLGGCRRELEQTLEVPRPLRWDVATPRLYTARSVLRCEGRDRDRATTSFGIRTFKFTADDGFHLNGRRVQLKGVNLHHDHGPLGAAFFPAAMERQLRIMQDMGANAIRTSHNAPAPELLKLCDELGLLVFNELFDKWDATADLLDSGEFEAFMTRQSQAFVHRDRNHPCVVVWSIGNEMDSTVTSAQGIRQIAFMAGLFRQLDPTRPVTLADWRPEEVCRGQALASLDVTSWNYGRSYALSRERFPDKPIIYSESASALSTRGFYRLPHPASKIDYEYPERYVDSYDLNSASGPRDIPDWDFRRMETDRYVAGEFVWTGFDYLGEPTPFPREAHSSYFGIVDLAGIPKDRDYLYRSHWAPEKTTLHILPHWNWPNRVGQAVPVFLYTNGDSAELFLNGRSLGRRSKQRHAGPPGNPAGSKPATAGGAAPARYYDVIDRYRLRWEDVVYQPGELKAVAYRDGRRIGEATRKTAGPPAAIRLTPARTELRADGNDLCYITVEMVDADGTVCPLAMDEIAYAVEGPATLAGVGNGDPLGLDSFADHTHPLFYGKAVAILRSRPGETGTVTLKTSAKGIGCAVHTMRSRPARGATTGGT
ncbi:MAG: DUF4982 domain-containing protein [Kiritimatiellaeota bacterium]|nr:DUF4982 domain-containing protein [Kiritimatiellota bacterium]